MSLRPNARTEVRRNRYKVAVDADEGRRRREDNMVEIRKSKREESLQKKRREGLQATQQPQFAPSAASTVEKKVKSLWIWNPILGICVGFWTDLDGFRFCLSKLESLPSMIGGVWSEDRNLQLEATTQFRKLLSIGNFADISMGFQA